MITVVGIVTKERDKVTGGPDLGVKEGFLEEVAFELKSKLSTLKDRQDLIRPVVLNLSRYRHHLGNLLRYQLVATHSLCFGWAGLWPVTIFPSSPKFY